MELTQEQRQMMARYETVKMQIKELEEEAKSLSSSILVILPRDKEIACESGKLYIQNRTVWKYSKEVEEKEDEVKNLKKEEQAKGIAAAENIPTLYYRANK